MHVSHGWHLYYTLSGFSVAFGSTGCNGSAGGRASFASLARTLSARGTNSKGVRGHAPPSQEICKINSLKCNCLHSQRWCTNEKWERPIRTDALWSKIRVSCRRTCLVSYSLQGRGKGWEMMNNDFILHVYDRDYLFFFRLCTLHDQVSKIGVKSFFG